MLQRSGGSKAMKMLIFIGGQFDGQRIQWVSDGDLPEKAELKMQIGNGPVIAEIYKRVNEWKDTYIYEVAND